MKKSRPLLIRSMASWIASSEMRALSHSTVWLDTQTPALLNILITRELVPEILKKRLSRSGRMFVARFRTNASTLMARMIAYAQVNISEKVCEVWENIRKQDSGWIHHKISASLSAPHPTHCLQYLGHHPSRLRQAPPPHRFSMLSFAFCTCLVMLQMYAWGRTWKGPSSWNCPPMLRAARAHGSLWLLGSWCGPVSFYLLWDKRFLLMQSCVRRARSYSTAFYGHGAIGNAKA